MPDIARAECWVKGKDAGSWVRGKILWRKPNSYSGDLPRINADSVLPSQLIGIGCNRLLLEVKSDSLIPTDSTISIYSYVRLGRAISRHIDSGSIGETVSRINATWEQCIISLDVL
ncbi:MAG TPA: hypothetical protein VMW46_08530, partial [Candidatus Desulfaltia sp.]|nr:hypothetical protein [Candidatus Desulfaltia sp.]